MDCVADPVQQSPRSASIIIFILLPLKSQSHRSETNWPNLGRTSITSPQQGGVLIYSPIKSIQNEERPCSSRKSGYCIQTEDKQMAENKCSHDKLTDIEMQQIAYIYLFPRAAIRKHQRLVDFKNRTKLFILRARISRSRCWWGWHLLRVLGEGSVPASLFGLLMAVFSLCLHLCSFYTFLYPNFLFL